MRCSAGFPIGEYPVSEYVLLGSQSQMCAPLNQLPPSELHTWKNALNASYCSCTSRVLLPPPPPGEMFVPSTLRYPVSVNNTGLLCSMASECRKSTGDL